MRKKSDVAIVMPVYNNEKYVKEAIESILKQTYKHIDLFIVDDASIDNSWKIIKEFASKHKNIKAFRLQKNEGPWKARNYLLKKILKEKNYKYIGFLDGDDISIKQRVEKQVRILKNYPEIYFVGTQIAYIDEKGKVLGKRNYPTKYKNIKKEIIKYNPIAFASLIVKREVFEKIGLFKEDFKVAEDYEFIFRMVNKFKGITLNEILYLYRQHQKQIKNKKLKETIKATINIQLKYLFRKEYFSVAALIYIIGEMFLLLLPKKFVLWLFFKINKKKIKNTTFKNK